MDMIDSFDTHADAVVVKVSFNGDLRRFPFSKGAPFQALYEQVAAILGLAKDSQLSLKYTDEDGDLITISSDWELNSAIKPGQLLRLTAFTKGPQATAPVLPEAPHAFPGYPAGPFGSGPAPAGPFGGPPPFGAHAGPFGGPSPAGPFGSGPAHAGPFGGPFGSGPAPAGPFGGPFGHGPAPAGRFGAPFPGGAFAGGCGGWGRGRFSHEDWKQLKKDRKSHLSPEEWKQLKEERRRMCKEHKKGKHGRGHPHPGYFGPHFGGPFAHPHHFGQFPDVDADKLTARFVKDVTIEDGAHIPAGTPFTKTWRIRNEGEAWPVGCMLRLLTKHSDSMASPETVAVPVEGAVGTGVEFDIAVPLVSPAKAGRYTAYFKMCTPAGKKFGQRLWVSIVVPSLSSSSSSEGEKEADKYEGLVDAILAMGFTVKRHRVFRLLQKNDGDVEKVTQVLNAKTQRKALKEQMKAQKAQKKAAKNQL